MGNMAGVSTEERGPVLYMSVTSLASFSTSLLCKLYTPGDGDGWNGAWGSLVKASVFSIHEMGIIREFRSEQ